MARIGTVIRDVYRRPGTEGLAAHLQERYGVTVTACRPFDVGTFRVDLDDGGSWVARAMLTARPYERTLGDAEVLARLAALGVPAERLATKEAVSPLGERAVLVTSLVPGRRAKRSPRLYRQLGATLGRLATLEPEGALGREAGALHHLPAFEAVAGGDLAAAAALLDDLEGRPLGAHEEVYTGLRRLLERGDSCEGLPRGPLHPDPVLSNVLDTKEGPVLIDWTGAGSGPRLLSLAALLGAVGPAGAADALAGYGEHVILEAEELERLEGALWVRPLWFACWECWLAVVSPKVDRCALPNGKRIGEIARAARRAALAGEGPG